MHRHNPFPFSWNLYNVTRLCTQQNCLVTTDSDKNCSDRVISTRPRYDWNSWSQGRNEKKNWLSSKNYNCILYLFAEISKWQKLKFKRFSHFRNGSQTHIVAKHSAINFFPRNTSELWRLDVLYRHDSALKFYVEIDMQKKLVPHFSQLSLGAHWYHLYIQVNVSQTINSNRTWNFSSSSEPAAHSVVNWGSTHYHLLILVLLRFIHFSWLLKRFICNSYVVENNIQ